MQRNVENVRIVVRQFLRAVAVMDVPVDDGDASDVAMLLQVLRCDGHRVEVTEAERFPTGMMTRRSNESEAVLQPSIENVLGQFNGIANGETARASSVIFVPNGVDIILDADATAGQLHEGAQTLIQ